MKNFLLILFVALYSSICYSQIKESTYNKLFEYYPEEYLTRMKSSSPQKYEYLLTYVEKGYYIEKSEKDNSEFKNILDLYQRQPKGKPVKRINSETLNEKDFNILFFDITAQENRQYYAFGNTGAILVVLSQRELVELINKK